MLRFLFLGYDENRTAHNHNPNHQLKMRDQMTFWYKLIMVDHFCFWDQLNLLETEEVIMIEKGAKKQRLLLKFSWKETVMCKILRKIIMI